MAHRTTQTPKPMISARALSPVIPTSLLDRQQLQEDLSRMGCLGLYERPWSLKSDEMVQELVSGPPNQFEKTLRGHPPDWTADMWADVYGCAKSGHGLGSRKDKQVHEMFHHGISSKDGFSVSDCKNARHRRVLEFLVPILYPEKPTRVTITIANTIFGALGERKVSWGVVIQGAVSKLAEGILSRGRTSVISPYLFHLYKFYDILTVNELCAYNSALNLQLYNLSAEYEKEMRQSEHEGETPEPKEPTPEKKGHRKNTDPEGRGKKPTDEGGPSGHIPADPFAKARKWMDQARNEHFDMGISLGRICDALGGVKPDDILTEIERRTRPEILLAKEEQIRNLEKIRDEFHIKAVRAEEAATAARQREADALSLVRNLKDLLQNPAEVQANAELFRSRLAHEAITQPRIVVILSEFHTKLEILLKDMRALLEPDRALDFTQFPEVPGNVFEEMQTPHPTRPSGDPFLSPMLTGPEVTPPAPRTDPGPSSTPAPTSTFPPPGKPGTGSKAGSLPIRQELINRIEAMTNPAQKYPADFEHMQESPPPEKQPEDIVDLDEEESNGSDPDVQEIKESEEESAHTTDSETESEPEREVTPAPPPARTPNVTTRSAAKSTPPTKSSGRKTPAPKGGASSSKKARRGR